MELSKIDPSAMIDHAVDGGLPAMLRDASWPNPAFHAEREAMTARLMEAERVIAEQRLRLSALETLTVTDELTGLNNRRGFFAELGRQLARARRKSSARGVLIMADIDDFKKINDRRGHLMGDAYLRRVAELLTELVRETDSVARFGGDEFAVLLTDTDKANGERRGLEISRQLNNAWCNVGTARVTIRVSMGMHIYGGDDEGVDVIRAADQALYRNKAERREQRRRSRPAPTSSLVAAQIAI
ncbi:MAG TPA: GGDEF domain-containing protein [Stellaceae bacterium]|nr:GGDEF domain-containing protein [Stellaceae bacterium]